MKLLPDRDPACFSLVIATYESMKALEEEGFGTLSKLHFFSGLSRASDRTPLKDLSSYCNQPLLHKRARLILPRLKARLEAHLPAYLIPHHFVFLAQLPLTRHGKIDRSALPLPGRGQQTEHYQAPRSQLEKQLCRIFSELLAVEQVGLQDSFFDLGGHSLLAIQLLIRLRAHTGQEIQLSELFAHPRVAELAARLDRTEKEARPLRKKLQSHRGLKLRKAPQHKRLKLSYSQELWWTIFPTQAELEHGIQNSYAAIEIQGTVDIPRLERSFQAIIARHDVLRTRFENVERRPSMLIENSVSFELPVHRFHKAEKELILKALEDNAQAPFQLSQAPLMRAALYLCEQSSNSEKSWLMLSVSHLIFDGWSLKNLLHELNILYGAAVQGRGGERSKSPDFSELPDLPDLPKLPYQYADYAYWHRKWINKQVLRKQMLYWLRKGQDMQVVLDLPTDNPRSSALSFAGASVSFAVPPEQLQALKEVAQTHNASLYMLLMAAFQLMLFRYSGNPDIFVGTPVANRPARELEPMLGLFVNFIVIRGRLQAEMPFADFVAQIRQNCLEAFAHQDLPFQMLVKAFRAYKKLTAWRGFHLEQTLRSNVMFNLVDDFGSDFQIGPLRARLLPLENHYAAQSLHMILLQSERGIQGQLSYSRALFKADTIGALVESYQGILREIVHRPQFQLGDSR